MRVVVDTNRMRKPELMAFLMLDARHKAVINDYSAIESYKEADTLGVIEHFRIVSSFPDQVIVLKDSQSVGGLDPARGPMADRMIDLDQTAFFPKFSAAMANASAGDPSVVAQIKERGVWARDHLSSMVNTIADSREVMSIIRRLFTPEQWKTFTRGEPFTPKMQNYLHTAIMLTAEELASGLPRTPTLPDAPLLYDNFVFRLAVCQLIHLVNLAGLGTVNRSAKQTLNDQIDIFHAAYGTYFNGLMTSDDKAAQTHRDARHALQSLGVQMPIDYAQETQGRVVNYINEARVRAGRPPLT